MMPGVNQDQSDKDSEPFVEIDPTGRYGRYSELLGSGAVKKVYRAFDQEEGIEVAWNQVKLRNFSNDPSMIDRLYSEVRLLRSLTNKNIISLYNVWRDEEHNTLNFITEVCTSGNLREYRKKHRQVSIKALKKWSKQILKGLDYFHTHDPCIIHRDLNCSNVFVNGNTGQYRLRLVIWEWLRLWERAIQRIQSSGHRNSWRRSCTRNITPSSSTYTHSGCVC
ncbi:hypothetical protein ERO13_D13G139300v2 [Gossypium hirsutum]|nr:hypothetical protein ERO13_D13G139300v2 [Gossypium hirsutum]